MLNTKAKTIKSLNINTNNKVTVIVSELNLSEILVSVYIKYVRELGEHKLKIYRKCRDESIDELISMDTKRDVTFIDQIEVGLTPSKQQYIIRSIQESCPDTKLIITTNSPIILTTVERKCVRIIRRIDDKFICETPDIQTKGVSCCDILSTIMNTHAIPQIKESEWVSDLHALITEGEYETEEAVELINKVVSHFGEDSSTVFEIKRCIRLSEIKSRFI